MSEYLSNFWDVIWTVFLIFAFVAYFMILISVITDLFRDRALNGWYKALWVIFLVFLPYLAALVYLIARGRGMAERQHEAALRSQEAANAYIREAAGSASGPASEIQHAKSLLDSGVISAEEFARLKAKALA